ncbi:DUF4838 domain-containing protein [Paenibacillus mendelii]|uniref:DUF4838 domain-containing protein n=1 Tax=Paenibacillus mendelii TaxID=206163 RepID=A0ABV6JEV3_9BACL|nr:DUF4838 domain-containing protein [Paenibacillus mendelii]MCQ6557322.1 DUF4838 domain-containing protein [Paenibacillus mendelii]
MTEQSYPIPKLTITGIEISKYIIIHGEFCSPSEKTAAQELQFYIERSCGVQLPVTADSNVESPHEILVGTTNRRYDLDVSYACLGDDGFYLQVKESKLYIVGSPTRGTLYGVYTLLEDYLGWRWFAPVVEQTILSGDAALPGNLDVKFVPIVEYRDTYWYSSLNENWAVKLKVNSIIKNQACSRSIREEWGGGLGYGGPSFVHTFNVFMPISEYFAEHPEYYSLREGKRNGEHLYTQLCLTNPDVLRIMTDKVLNCLQEEPQAGIVSVSQDDSFLSDSYCQCDDCERIHQEEGSPMGSLLRFVNAIADAVKVKHPKVIIDTLAYQHTFTPPKITRPRDNVAIRICTFSPVISRKHEEQPHIKESLEIWSKICNRIYIWDYTTNFSDYIVTFPNFHTLLPNMRLFVNNHAKGIFEQGNYQSISGEFGELRTYLLAQLLWKPDQTETDFERHMNEFLQGYYGAGWQFIRQYIDDVQEIVLKSEPGARGTPTEILPPALFDAEQAKAWWDQAEALAGDEHTLQRIRRSRLQLIHWELFNNGHTDDMNANAYYKMAKDFGITHLNEGVAVPEPRSC